MLFSSFAPFALIAFAASAFAAPSPAAADVVVARDADIIARDFGVEIDELARRKTQSVKQILTTTSATIIPIVNSLKAGTTTPAAGIQAIISALTATKTDLNTFKATPFAVLTAPSSAIDIIAILGPLLTALLPLLATLIGGGDIDIASLIAIILPLLSTILPLITGSVPGSSSGVLAILTSLLPVLSTLDWTSLLGLFGGL